MSKVVRLPTFSSIPEFTDAGALVGYGPSRRYSYRRAATYVKKVLEGAKPADIQVGTADADRVVDQYADR